MASKRITFIHQDDVFDQIKAESKARGVSFAAVVRERLWAAVEAERYDEADEHLEQARPPAAGHQEA